MKKLNILLLPLCLITAVIHAQSGNVGIGTNAPKSMLQVNGSVAFGYRTVSGSAALTGSDYTVEYTGTAAATLTLPDATTCRGRSYHIKNVSTTTPTPVVTIAPQAGQTADSKTTWILDTKNELAYIMSDGANWHVYAQMVPTPKSDTTGGAWLEGGNTDQGTAIKKFGTVSNNDLPFITNNTERIRITASGNIGIGTSSPSYKLDVAGAARCTGAMTIGAYTLPSTDGTSNQVLTTGGSGAVTWQSLSSIITAGWSLSGNSGTSPGTNFIGTTDNQSLVFKANNLQAGKIDIPLSNTSFGYQSAAAITTATGGTFIGFQSGFKVTTGLYNTAIGTSALATNTTGAGNTAVGNSALKSTTASGNTAVGISALSVTSSGGSNTAIGAYSMQSNTTGGSNTAHGYSAMGSNTTGTNNTAIGSGSFQANTTGISNAALGSGALQFSTTANNNTSLGAFSSQYTTTGASNTAVGYGASGNATTGSFNTVVGNSAGTTNITGSNNTFVGSSADATTAALTNATAIGFYAKVSASNALILGGTGLYASNVGIGNTAPTAKLEITSNTANTSGVKFTNLTKNSTITPGVGVLGVDTNGNVVLASASSSERANYVLVKSAADFPAAVGGVRTLVSNTQYEISGQVVMTDRIDINQAVIKGSDATDDMLVYASGSSGLFTGANGGVIKDLTLVATTAGGAVFNINAGGASQNLIIQHCFMVNSASLGTIKGFAGTVYLESVAFQNNTNGITYQDNTNFVEVNMLWDVSNHNTYEKFIGTFGVIQILGGDRLTTSANSAIGIDITGLTAISYGSVKQLMFTGTGTYVSGAFSSAWEVESYGLNTQKDDVSSGCFYISTPAATSFSAVNTPVKVLGTTTSSTLFRTTMPASNRLQYAGNKTKTFTAVCSLTGMETSGTTSYSFYIAKNGVVLPESRQQMRFTSATDQRSLSISCSVSMAPADYIEIWAANNTDATDLSVQSLNLSMK